MWEHLLLHLFIVHSFHFAESGFPPMGDEVQAGSVLLPASRRGRYLANIVRRQAVDGTGIKFNKDADRMNAEAKKKVDVLSEELLPYIIAEQERRTTLYKRVMTAIQNGEKGVTIAEIRNKPPTIIRKGLMYRCPTNRAPKEPDGSGVMMCEDDQRPKDIIFESCLSAEDKELFVADNKYFFCNRHKIEGSDLPHNGSRVIGCAPCERTPLNYTSQRCALEDTADVVVHYRYYPDRTYKFVSELDPEREVCDHWNPCQIGYIFSLPGPDQATPANELWQDTNNETVIPGEVYATSMRRVHIPRGFHYHGIGKYHPKGQRRQDSEKLSNLHVHAVVSGEWAKITMVFTPLHHTDLGTYFVRFERLSKKGDFLYVPLVTISLGKTQVHSDQVVALPMTRLGPTTIWYTCEQCTLSSIMLRGADGAMRNVDKYRLHKTRDKKTEVEFDWGTVKFSDLGDYFLIVLNEDGFEERLFALSFKDPPLHKHIRLKRITSNINVASPVDTSVGYTCTDEKLGCSLLNVMCNGESAISDGMVAHQASSKRFTFSYASFDDKHACAFLAMFKVGDYFYRKILAVFETVEVVGGPLLVVPPEEGTPYMHVVRYKCHDTQDCSLFIVTVNGFPLELGGSTQESASPVAFYIPGELSITIGIAAYNSLYEGVYMGVFMVDGANVSKVLMEIRPDQDTDSVHEDEGTDSTSESPTSSSSTEAPGGKTDDNPEKKQEPEPDQPVTPPGDKTDTPPGDNPDTPPEDKTDTPPGDNSDTPPGDNSDTPPGDNPDTPPGEKTDNPPGDHPETPPGEKTDNPPGDHPETPPGEKTDNPPGDHPETPPGEKTDNPPGDNPETPPGEKTDNPPGDNPETPPGEKTDNPPGDNPETPPGEKTDNPPGDNPETPTGEKTDNPPGDNPETPPGEKTDNQPGDNPETPPEDKTDTRRIAVAVDTPPALVRGAVAAGGVFRGAVRGSAGALAGVRCRGQYAGAAWQAAPDGTLRLDIQHFKDSNACVYVGIFKTGNTEHRKTLAVLEMIQVASSKVEAPPAGGALKHSVVYTCNLTKCDPQMIYINDRTLKSNDKNHFYSFKIKKGEGHVTTVTVDLSIVPFTPDFEGVYQVVVSDGKQTITKNLLEVGKLI